MALISWVSLVISIFSITVGQISYKLFSRNKKWGLLLVAIAGFVLAQIANYLALRSIDVGITYMFMGSNQILILLASVFLLKEKISRTQIFAILLIVLGILLYGYGYPL